MGITGSGGMRSSAGFRYSAGISGWHARPKVDSRRLEEVKVTWEACTPSPRKRLFGRARLKTAVQVLKRPRYNIVGTRCFSIFVFFWSQALGYGAQANEHIHQTYKAR